MGLPHQTTTPKPPIALTLAWRWITAGVDPALNGTLRRRQYITNAVPALVLLMVLFYYLLFLVLGNGELARSCLQDMPIPAAGVAWFRWRQACGQPPHYWKACFICQTTVLAGILGGQGTLFGSHFYFLLFFLTAPLIVPISDRRGMTIVCAICLGWFSFFQFMQWPATPSVQTLGPTVISLLNLGVLLSGSIILFVALLAGEHFSDALVNRIQLMASTDMLTGLANRRAFYSRLAQLQFRHQLDQHPFCLAMLDIDFFKRINDNYGHDTGDKVLCHIAKLLQHQVRAQDLVCRIGGEEFAILLPDTSMEQAFIMCEAIRNTIASSPLAHGARALHATVSLGLAQWQSGDSEQAFLAATDKALYAAKHAGRNGVQQRRQTAPAV
ncbi:MULTISPECIES: GGDEF domain-containing protein [Aquitalea]|uniref:diguanylate cyclase n=1 Tax=Aquitalea magnusonii TaxID=332411 RepID=A0A318JKE4_9NEIS|nr:MULTISPECIES: GGDEF domain-containing protein [Aquitalea]PXX48407.1 diguanylate cyclase (GGDEF)-like protein [Aquitalea magnusonii]